MKFSSICSATLVSGLSLGSAVLPWNYSQLSRSVALPYMLRRILPLSQKYLAVNQSLSPIDTVDLGASIAETYGKAIGPVQRKLCTSHLSLLFRSIDYAISFSCFAFQT